MRKLSRVLCLAAALLGANAPAEMIEAMLDDPTFGKLAVYHATDEPKGVILFASGTGGWNADLAAVARDVAKLEYVVTGINLDDYLTRLDRSNATCADLAVDLDRLNRLMEERYPIATHQPSILLGYGAGAALTYAALAQAPDDQFHAGVAVDFCPQLPLRKPLCKGPANLESAAPPDNKGVLLKPVVRLPTTWFVFQNRPVCDAKLAEQFVKSIQLARLTDVPGADGVKIWLPQVSALLQWLDPGIVKQVQPDASVSGVPLTEVPATGGPDRPQFAVMLSGDGGWALLDRAVTAELAKKGLPAIGWDSLSYFWKARQPDEVALDLERILRHYLEIWKKDRIVLLGYSFGADVLPAVTSRLPQELRDRIDLVAFLGLSNYASFEFNLTDWVSDKPSEGDQPVRPELEKLSGLKRLCIYGAEEEGALCPNLTSLGVIAEKMPGDHHFEEDYQGVAQRIIDQLPPQPAAATQPSAKN
jgi:type IV secretory pathway VirJ component